MPNKYCWPFHQGTIFSRTPNTKLIEPVKTGLLQKRNDDTIVINEADMLLEVIVNTTHRLSKEIQTR